MKISPHSLYTVLISLLFIASRPVSAQIIHFTPDTTESIRLINSTFLGSPKRNEYGNRAPDTLEVIWRTLLGSGATNVGSNRQIWSGCGWTGQPLLVKEDGRLSLIIGAYDHHLKKIDAATGDILWQYEFDDVIKGTGTLFADTTARSPEESLIILQGSRRGIQYHTGSPEVPSYRAISFFSGKEMWRLNVPHTRSYSRDVDGSALILNGLGYVCLENSTLLKFDPRPGKAVLNQPLQLTVTQLYTNMDVLRHGGNLVAESSPCLLGEHLYLSAGSGHVFGYNLKNDRLDWDFYTGSDMDGSTVVTSDSCLLVTIEKQYITGKGGVYKLNPRKRPAEAVEWYFPVEDASFSSWTGGIIGSAGVNDATKHSTDPHLAVFSAIDGYLYLINYMQIDSSAGLVQGPNCKRWHAVPKLIWKKRTGASISTPLIIGDKIVAAGYGGVYLFQMDAALNVTQLAHVPFPIEAAPAVHDGKIYVGSRDGYLYCLGRK